MNPSSRSTATGAGTSLASDARPSAVRTWLLAIRPATLPAAATGVIVGLGAARATGAAFRADTAVGCLAVALLLQVAANLANDLSDFRRGADTAARVGPTRVAAAGLATPRELEIAIAVVLGVAALVGLALATVGGPAFLAVGAAAIVATLAYTGGPFPYGYRGLGEVFVFIFFGLVAVMGTAFLQAGRVELLHVLAAVPVGALITAILVVNNLRDVSTDGAVGKRTLAVILGDGFARAEYALCLAVAWAVPVVALLVPWGVPTTVGPLVLLPAFALPLAVPLWRTVRADGDPRRLNTVLRGTARLSLAFGVLLAIGLAAGRWPG